jgi:hypothetical protein
MAPVARVVPPPALRRHYAFLPLQSGSPVESIPFIFNDGKSCTAAGPGISRQPLIRVYVASFGFSLARSHRFLRRSARLLPYPALHVPNVNDIKDVLNYLWCLYLLLIIIDFGYYLIEVK